MWEFVLANFRSRPVRALLSIGSVALGVALVLLFAGLADGEIRERAERDQQIGAELIVYSSQAGAFGMLGLPLSLPVAYATSLGEIEGVKEVTPVGYLVQEGVGGTGFRAIEGIDPDSYARTSGLRIIVGRPLMFEDDALVDPSHARAHGISVGDRIDVLGRPFRVVGIFAPEMGARVKVRLTALQKLRGTPERCSFFLIKCVRPEAAPLVAERVSRRFPEFRLVFTQDLPRVYRQSVPALDVFLRVLVGVASLIGGLSVFVVMYAAVSERTHEIGLLKSLGASRRWIMRIVLQEAFGLGLVGTLLGVGVSWGAGGLIMRTTSLSFHVEGRWMLIAALMGVGSCLLGSFYPAVRAARLDPVVALAKTT
ncbi:Macrolide export ATP-binding/permease protein MacB [bacterium HR10]|nr:Macrolide export ATP-binding/permease protein MacB [bacterium HR10]